MLMHRTRDGVCAIRRSSHLHATAVGIILASLLEWGNCAAEKFFHLNTEKPVLLLHVCIHPQSHMCPSYLLSYILNG